MSRIIKLELKCGEKTCSDGRGNICQYLRSRIGGTDPFCKLFGDVRLFDKDYDIWDWLLRCPECLNAEAKEEENNFTVIEIPEDEDGRYYAYVPDQDKKRCYAYGNTASEAVKNLKNILWQITTEEE